MLEDKYLERLGKQVILVDSEIREPLEIGKFVQRIYQFLLSEQERDMREEKNKWNKWKLLQFGFLPYLHLALCLN